MVLPRAVAAWAGGNREPQAPARPRLLVPAWPWEHNPSPATPAGSSVNIVNPAWGWTGLGLGAGVQAWPPDELQPDSFSRQHRAGLGLVKDEEARMHCQVGHKPLEA